MVFTNKDRRTRYAVFFIAILQVVCWCCILDWEQIEKEYAELFPSSTSTVAKPQHMAPPGCLDYKERCHRPEDDGADHRIPIPSAFHRSGEIPDRTALRSLVDGSLPETGSGGYKEEY